MTFVRRMSVGRDRDRRRGLTMSLILRFENRLQGGRDGDRLCDIGDGFDFHSLVAAIKSQLPPFRIDQLVTYLVVPSLLDEVETIVPDILVDSVQDLIHCVVIHTPWVGQHNVLRQPLKVHCLGQHEANEGYEYLLITFCQDDHALVSQLLRLRGTGLAPTEIRMRSIAVASSERVGRIAVLPETLVKRTAQLKSTRR